MNCRDCGAPNAQSQRTGKWYCSAKCWLGPQQAQTAAQKPQQQQQNYQQNSGFLNRDDKFALHEIEQRGIKSSVARQKATDTVNAMISAGLIKTKDDIALCLDFFASKNLKWLLNDSGK